MAHPAPEGTPSTQQSEDLARSPRRVSPWSLLLAGGIAYAVIAGWWGLLVGVIGLALLITVHEFGHFIAAKAFGMRVEKFYVGFPPAALRHTWGETEYGIGIIPLGGFCKISGMTPEEEVPEGTGDRLYYLKPVWQRNVAIFAGPLMNFIAAAVILIVFVAVQGVPTATLTIDEVVAGGPADKAGITAGAVIVAADGTEFATWEEASAYFRAHPSTTIELTYVPEGASETQTRTVEVTLTEHPQQPGAGYLGVRSAVVADRPGPLRAVVLGMEGFWAVVTGTFKGFGMLFSGEISATGPDGVMGPVGILDVSQDAVEQDWYPVLLAFLSFNLGFINLLPILPFDGGHIAFNLLERVRGKRLSSELFTRIAAVVTVLLLTLFVLLTLNDVRRIIGG